MKLTGADTILFQLLHGLINEIMAKTACKSLKFVIISKR